MSLGALPAHPAWFRHERDGAAFVGAVDPTGDEARWLDLGPLDVVALLCDGGLRQADLAQRMAAAPSMAAPTRWLPPVPRGGKILCLAKNYVKHAREFGAEAPKEPIFFAKLPDTLVAHGDDVVIPSWLETRVDHEAELALVIGEEARDLEPGEALACVAALTVANDLTARSLQGADRKQGYPWLRGKNMDGFLPLGPALVPSGFLDPHDLNVSCTVGNEVRQDASTRDLVVRIPEALAWLSRHLTLRPGDLVLMGTPEGVGPLEDGDVVRCSIPPIGSLLTTVRRPD